MSKHVIYSNYHDETDEHGKDAYDYARESLFEVYAEERGWKTQEDVPLQQIYEQVAFDDEADWEEFEREFGKFLESGMFLLVGSFGTWRGRFAGGGVIQSFRDLLKFWKDCDYVKAWDEDGHLYVQGTHHDGTNTAEIRQLNLRGQSYMSMHDWDCDEEAVHGTVFKSNFYSCLPHYAHKVFGCKKYA